jgi:AcrR family transcriptional regulator
MVERRNKKKAGTEASPEISMPIEWRGAGSRNERSALIRAALLQAAASIVGEIGYQDTSISLITQRVGVAQGTFYNHFDSRQDILDQLLPTLGRDMLLHVQASMQQGRDLPEREELALQGFFSYLKKAPHFMRILNEAGSFAPKAYEEHVKLVTSGYLRFLQRAHKDGELPNFEPREFEVVAFLLMAARAYLAPRFIDKRGDVPDWVVKAYTKFVLYGLRGTRGVGAGTGPVSAYQERYRNDSPDRVKRASKKSYERCGNRNEER